MVAGRLGAHEPRPTNNEQRTNNDHQSCFLVALVHAEIPAGTCDNGDDQSD